MTDNRMNIVLVEPEIPPNTGNVARTCIALSVRLHLVGRLGFSLEDRQLRRAGLDYWPSLDFKYHQHWADFLATVEPGADICFFSTKGRELLWKKEFKAPLYLVFGSESRGFPEHFYTEYREKMIRIPVGPDVRSLNLATAVGVAAFEAARQLDWFRV